MSRTITFERPDGTSVAGCLAEPNNAAAASAIVVIQEWWGLNPQIRGVADRLALAGYRALVPDLYRGNSTAAAEEANHLMNNLNFADAAAQAEQDSSFPIAGVAALEETLRRANVAYTGHRYLAQHGFANETAQGIGRLPITQYDAAWAQVAWDRSFGFFARHLGQ